MIKLTRIAWEKGHDGIIEYRGMIKLTSLAWEKGHDGKNYAEITEIIISDTMNQTDERLNMHTTLI